MTKTTYARCQVISCVLKESACHYTHHARKLFTKLRTDNLPRNRRIIPTRRRGAEMKLLFLIIQINCLSSRTVVRLFRHPRLRWYCQQVSQLRHKILLAHPLPIRLVGVYKFTHACRNSHHKNEMVEIFMMGIHILARRCLYIESAPDDVTLMTVVCRISHRACVWFCCVLFRRCYIVFTKVTSDVSTDALMIEILVSACPRTSEVTLTGVTLNNTDPYQTATKHNKV